METPHPPSDTESAATQPWEQSDPESDSDSDTSLLQEHNLTAEVYNTSINL